MVGDELLVRSRDECGEAFEESQGIENDLRGAILPSLLQRVGDPAIRQHGQTIVSNRWAADVADQMFETIGATGGHAGRGVQAEAIEIGTEAARAVAELDLE